MLTLARSLPLKAILAALVIACAAAVVCSQETPEEGPPVVLPPAAAGEGAPAPERPVIGRVTDLNPVRGYVELESFPGGISRVVVVTPTTQMTKPAAIKATELQVGDVVRVSGIWVQLQASSISVEPPSPPAQAEGASDGQHLAEPSPAPPAATPTPGDGEAPEGDAGPEERGSTPAGGAPVAPGPPPTQEQGERPSRPEGTVTVSGVVKSVEPLTIALSELSDALSITVTVTDTTVVTKSVPATIEDLKQGDFVWASGQRNANDLLEAAQLRIVSAEEVTARFGRFTSSMGGGQEGGRGPSERFMGGSERGGGGGGFGDRSSRGRGRDR